MKIFGSLDFRQPSGGSGGLTQSQINIIEANTGTQIDVRVGYTEVDWTDGVPTGIRKYEDSTKAAQLYAIVIMWLDGVPTTIVSNNLDDGIITTTTITWSNGVPISINKG